jgi:hypothetical protein
MLDDGDTVGGSFGPGPTRTLKTPFHYRASALPTFSLASLQPRQLPAFSTSRLANHTRDQSQNGKFGQIVVYVSSIAR